MVESSIDEAAVAGSLEGCGGGVTLAVGGFCEGAGVLKG